ncbi:hypothetical protein O9992_25030 [Vibrio lentus]|nr:hypothetical protein [Vibrio lentus]
MLLLLSLYVLVLLGICGTVGVALMGVAAGLDVSLWRLLSAPLFLAHILAIRSRLFQTQPTLPVVSGTTLYERIQHMLYTTLLGFVIASCCLFLHRPSADISTVGEPEKVTPNYCWAR